MLDQDWMDDRRPRLAKQSIDDGLADPGVAEFGDRDEGHGDSSWLFSTASGHRWLGWRMGGEELECLATLDRVRKLWHVELLRGDATAWLGTGETIWEALAIAITAALGKIRGGWHTIAMHGEAAKVQFMMRPIHDHVVIAPEGTPDKIGSIYVPDSAKVEFKVGRVLAVGPGEPIGGGARNPMDVQVGDRVIYEGDWQGTDWEGPDGQKYKVLQQRQIAAIVDRSADIELERLH